VAVERGETVVKGYYTITSGAVSFKVVPENLLRHPVPVVLLARLAVDRTTRGEGLGAMLLLHALKRAQDVSEQLGMHAVAVDALNDSARAFYLKYGFTELLDDPLHLFLPIKKIRQLGL
jgi:GNAT superfamily N-acetyltransferase